jgi:hypothetical protein
MYLISEIQCHSEEVMDKRFKLFSNENDARIHFNQLKEFWIHDLCEDLDCSVFELEIEAGTYYDTSSIWNYISEDGSLEVEIELTELEVF